VQRQVDAERQREHHADEQRGQHRRAAAGLAALTVLVWAAFAAWPIGIWTGHAAGIGVYGLDGLIWAIPNTMETTFTQLGDQPWYPEYHYRGLELVGGNLYILAGLVLFTLLAGTAIRLTRQRSRTAAAGEQPTPWPSAA